MSVLERVRKAESERAAQPRRAEGLLAGKEGQRVRERLKALLVERLGLATIAGMLGEKDVAQVRTELAVTLEAILNTQDFEALGGPEREALVRRVLDEVCGLGPIQPLMDDPEVTEVVINGPDSLFYEKGGVLHPAPMAFDSGEQIMVTVDRILAPLGRRLDQASPLVDARLANGSRVNAVAKGVGINGPLVTIRKFSEKARSLERLVGLGSLPAWYATLLAWAVRSRTSVAVAGGTGSGKTTLLNALSCQIPPSERIVTIEDSAELSFDAHPNVARMEARGPSIEGTGEVTIRALVKNALRMRPDRIVVGEVRGEECIDMLQAMNTGHDGSLTTLHAGSAQEAVLRLVLMARFGMDLPTQLIEEQIATAINLVVVARRLAGGRRVVASLTELARSPTGTVELTERVAFDAAAGTWRLLGEPEFVGRAVESGTLSREEVEAWRRCLP